MSDRPPAIGLWPQHSDRNAFVNLFTRIFVRLGYRLHDSPYSVKDLRKLDAFVMHWPWMLKSDCTTVAAVRGIVHIAAARRLFGLKLVYVAHNVTPHNGQINPLVARLFYRQLDGIVYLSERSRELVRAHNPIHKGTAELVTVHGVYESGTAPAPLPDLETAEAARLLNFGQVRAYKGLEELIAASAGSGIAVHIIGKVYEEAYATSLHRAASHAENIVLDLRDALIGDAELEAAIDASHGVVLPYRQILNSGAAIHALSRHRPVLVPALGSMPELRDTVGADWVHLFDGTLDAADLQRFAAAVARLPRNARPDLSRLSWDRVGRDLGEFLASLGSHP